MCHVPSWVKKGKDILFLTDKDAKQHRIALHNATGHSAIQRVFKHGDGNSGEGLHARTPQVVREAIESGEMNKLLEVGQVFVEGGGKWNIPSLRVEDLTIEKRATVTMSNLKRINDSLRIQPGSTLVAPNLTSIGGEYNIKGKLVAPKLKLED